MSVDYDREACGAARVTDHPSSAVVLGFFSFFCLLFFFFFWYLVVWGCFDRSDEGFWGGFAFFRGWCGGYFETVSYLSG